MRPVLGVDHGSKRIGLALSDPSGGMALPLRTIEYVSQRAVLREIAEICREREVELIVVGMPLNMDGSEGAAARAAADFARNLALRARVPVETYDERLTTAIADRALAECNVSPGKRRMVRDQAAAAQILQGFLDRRSNSACRDTN